MTMDLRVPGRASTGVLPTPVLVGVLCAVLLGLCGAGAWRATGGRWAVIETPSMGQAVPVGSLVLTRPRPVAQITVGDIITYRPPHLDSLYTHRVVAVNADGSLQVQGDLNGTPDPYPVTQHELIGQVIRHWRGLGWLLRGLPTMLLALVVLAAGTRCLVPARWRSSARVLGSCIVFAITSLLLRPFVHPVLVATTTDPDDHTLHATVVSTGLLPTRISGAPGQHVDLLSGQAGTVPVLAPTAGHPLMITGAVHLTGWWIILVAATCLLPLLWVLTVGLAPAPQSTPASNDQTGKRQAGKRQAGKT